MALKGRFFQSATLNAIRSFMSSEVGPLKPDPATDPGYNMARRAEMPEQHRDALMLLNLIIRKCFPNMEWYRANSRHDDKPEFVMMLRSGRSLEQRINSAHISTENHEKLVAAFGVGGIHTHENFRYDAYGQDSMFFGVVPHSEMLGYKRSCITGLDLDHLKANALLICRKLEQSMGIKLMYDVQGQHPAAPALAAPHTPAQ